MKNKTNRTTAIVGLVINILLCPGLGTIIAGKPGNGAAQLLLFILGIPFCVVLVGFPMILIAWVWALVDGINILSATDEN